MRLTRRFSPWLMLILCINGTIGSAWLFAPWYAAKIAGTGAIYAWLLSGLATLLVALCFAELSCLFPMAGGSAALPALSHGRLTSFVVSWTAWLSALTMSPIEVQAILQYASLFFPSLMISQQGVTSLSSYGFMWAAALMLCFCVINISSAKGLSRINGLLFVFKVGVIFLTIFSLIFYHFHAYNFTSSNSNSSGSNDWHAILVATATGGVAFAFTGFKHGVEMAGEASNTRWGIPLAIAGSVLICLLIYLGLQIAFIGAWDKSSFSGDLGPFASLAIALGMPILAKLLYADAVISPAGAGLVYMTSTARILYAMSDIGYIPALFKRLNAHGFPVVAIIFNFLLGMLLFLPFKGWQSLVSFLVSGMVISYAMGPISLICFRAEFPEKIRTFKIPLANISCFLAFYFCNLLCYWTGWDTLIKFSIAIGLGLICFFSYYFFEHKKIHTLNIKSANIKSASWLIPYLTGLLAISYFGSFGGKQIIPFGWDFLIIGIFSLFILWLAFTCRIKNLNERDFEENRSVLCDIVSV